VCVCERAREKDGKSVLPLPFCLACIFSRSLIHSHCSQLLVWNFVLNTRSRVIFPLVSQVICADCSLMNAFFSSYNGQYRFKF
jgi:hypothetical protein